MELECYCELKSLETRLSKSGDKVYYYLTISQNGKEKHLCIFDDKAFENEVENFKSLSQGTRLKLVCNYNYRYNKANLSVLRVELWKNN